MNEDFKPRMINDGFLDRRVSENLVRQRDLDKEAHVSSGKLSASGLGNPLQWQMLKAIGVPGREVDEYVLRKFLRGNHVEDWIIGHMDRVVEAQKPVEYRNTVGLVDAIVDMRDWDSGLGEIPHEVKSVTNLKFKRINREKAADPQHRLQATLYAMALDADHYAVDYVASDDYRIYTMVYRTEDTADAVDQIISEYDAARKGGIVPVFVPRYSWQANLTYSNYPDWMNLTEDEIDTKLLAEYPDAYNKLKSV